MLFKFDHNLATMRFSPVKVFCRFEVVVGLPRSDLEQVGRYCSHQYAALQQPEDFPTMSVKTEIAGSTSQCPACLWQVHF